jgi:hypothetical protein
MGAANAPHQTRPASFSELAVERVSLILGEFVAFDLHAVSSLFETRIAAVSGFNLKFQLRARARLAIDRCQCGGSRRSTNLISNGRQSSVSMTMDMSQVHDIAKRLVASHGAKAEAEAAQKLQEAESQADAAAAELWRRVRSALRDSKPPHES